MFYYMIRVLFWAAVYLLAVRLISRGPNQRLKNKYIGFAALLLCIISFLIPFENLFFTFPTLNSAYSYINRDNPELVIEGSDSALMVGESLSVFPKEETGWKLGSPVRLKTVLQTAPDNLFVTAYQYKNSEDVYLIVSEASGAELDLSDSQGSVFQTVTEVSHGSSQVYSYYACIRVLDSQYVLTANGKDTHLF